MIPTIQNLEKKELWRQVKDQWLSVAGERKGLSGA